MNSSISSSRRLIAVFFLACAGALAALIGASEWLVRGVAAPEDTLYKHVALFERTISPYVAFGDSHVARDFDAQAPVVNLGYPSENIEKMAWKAALYLTREPHPKTVLIQADPHLFSLYRTREGLGEYPQAFSGKPYVGLISLSGRYRPQLLSLWRAFLKNGGRLSSTIETTPQGALLSPGDLSRWSAAEIDQFTNYRVRLHAPERGFETSVDARRYRDMVERFVKAGADVCLVEFPTSPIYRERLAGRDEAARSRTARAVAFFKDIAKAPKVKYIDHSALYSNLALFRDPDHLNKKGAIKYGPVLQSACFGDLKDRSETDAVASLMR